MIGTPEYMSPEQAGTTALEVDLRTDIYALGVLLYELLAGALPFDPTTLRRAAALEMLRIIREEEPPRLSARVQSLGDAATDVAKRRHLDVRSLARKLRGELEWITMRALEKDPDRRYASASGFAHDVTRYLEHRPVEAGPPGTFYQMSKFARRHRVGIVAAGLFAMAAGAFAAVTTWQSQRVARLTGEKEEAQVRLAGLERMSKNEGVTVSLLWNGGDDSGTPSPDGRYVSFVDWSTGDIAIRDLLEDESRVLTDEGSWETPSRYGDVSIWSPDSRQVAYCWIDDGEGADLRVVDVDGSEPRILHHDPEGYAWPRAWSRDGRTILANFQRKDESSEKGHRDEISLVSVDDGSIRTIKELGDRHTRYIDLSPDGTQIVYSTPPEAGTEERDIFLLSADGRRETQLVSDPADDWAPFWTPDGKAVLFVSDRSGKDDLWMVKVVDGRPRGEPAVLKEGMVAGFDPKGVTQGGEYFFSTWPMTSEVYVTELDLATGELLEPAERISRRFAGSNGSPLWSPDGSRLAWISRRGFEETYVVLRSADGEERDLLPWGERLQLPAGRAAPHWHPDGRSLLVNHASSDGGAFRFLDVESGEATAVLDRDSQPVRGNWPALAREGRELLHVTMEGYEIRAADLTTGDFHTLYTSNGYVSLLALSPDGRQLAFFEADGALRPRRLMSIALEGGEPELIFELPEGERFPWLPGLTWSADGAFLLFGRGECCEEPTELWRASVEDGETRQLLTFPKGRVNHLSAHPDGRRIAYSLATKGGANIWALRQFLPDDEVIR